jgi:hypothetical protein
LPQEKWAILANGKSVKTFSGEISLLIKNKNIPIPVRICIGEKIDTPLLGMKFLEILKSDFSLNFDTNTHSLQFLF